MNYNPMLEQYSPQELREAADRIEQKCILYKIGILKEDLMCFGHVSGLMTIEDIHKEVDRLAKLTPYKKGTKVECYKDYSNCDGTDGYIDYVWKINGEMVAKRDWFERYVENLEIVR